MSAFKKWARHSVFSTVLFSAFFLLPSHVILASQVQVCKKVKQSLKVKSKNPKKIYCTIKPSAGKVGDEVEIKNEYNYIVALGRIVKNSRSSSIVVLSAYRKDVGSMAGYPVLLREQDNQDYWTATTAPF